MAATRVRQNHAVLGPILREARPKQWIKNVLVFAAPGAAGLLDDPHHIWRTLAGFACLCLAASGTYYWNDILDVDKDRLHPKKRFRPIASGELPIGVARVLGVVFLLGGVGLAWALNWKTGVTVTAYVVLTSTYTAYLKHVAVLDLAAVALGFVLRAITGGVVNDIDLSRWFLLTTTFGSLFIVTGKRFAEMVELGEGAVHTRKILEEYSLGFLRTILAASIGATIVTYCTWAFEVRELSGGDWPFYELSIGPMLTALMRYALVLERGEGGAPEEVFLADRVLQGLGLMWLVCVALGVYV